MRYGYVTFVVQSSDGAITKIKVMVDNIVMEIRINNKKISEILFR